MAFHHPSGYLGRDLEQNICTPAEIVAPLYRHIGGPFSLDAFCGRATRRTSIIEALYRVNFPREDGLQISWFGSVWGNPSFRILGEAFAKAWHEVCLLQRAHEAFIHGPFRSHRKYWTFFWRAQAACYIRKIRYLGWDDDFPFPTIVVYYGPHAERFMRWMAPLGVVRPLTPWHARHIMTEMSVSDEYETRLRGVLVETARAHPELSLFQLREQLELGDEDWQRLLSTPIGELVAPAPKSVREQAANEAPEPTNGVSKNGRRKKTKRSPPRVAGGDAVLEKILAKKKKGDTFKTANLMRATGLGRNTILRKLEAYPQIKTRRSGRGAFLEVTR